MRIGASEAASSVMTAKQQRAIPDRLRLCSLRSRRRVSLVRPMRCLLPIILLGAAVSAFAADDLKKYDVWITGDVLIDKKDRLLFRANKPVQGNSTGRLVLLGATKQTMNVLLPMYMKAAEKHMKVRLYGVLVPDPDAKDPKSPSVQFITWKVHLPSDPDDLPIQDKIFLGPNDKLPGYKVEPKSKKP